MSEAYPAAGTFAGAASVFAALGDTARLRIVARLIDFGPLSITRLAEGAEISRQAVTKHLRALGEAGLVRSVRAGRERIWEVQATRLAGIRRALDQIAARSDAVALGRDGGG